MFYVKGTKETEVDFNLREILPESCGLAAAVHLPVASQFVFDCLALQEHRGEKGAGIISSHENHLHLQKRAGKVKRSFVEMEFEKLLPGNVAIGHTRYATAGDPNSLTNVQPLFFNNSRFGPFAVAHNGTLVIPDEVRQRLVDKGAIFQSTTDSEVFGHVIASSQGETIEDAIAEAANQIKTAYCFLVITPDKVIALRDQFGVRPLALAKLDEGYLVCSESYTFDQYPDAHFIRDIEPGEMIIFENEKPEPRSRRFAPKNVHFCIFEGIYFSNPRSTVSGYFHEDFRQELGRQLWRENPDMQGDFVVPILDSGKQAATGLAAMSQIPYKEYFLRIHEPPRTNNRSFTSVTTRERWRAAYQKLHLRKERVQGKRVIVVDDSIVRSTTMKIVNQRLREAGAKEVINCITAPPIVNTCPLGMDFHTKSELAAYARSLEEIRKMIHSDKLIYLSLEGLKSVVEKTYQTGICTGCFGGSYPQPVKTQREPVPNAC